MYSAFAINGSGLLQWATTGRSQPHRSPSTSRGPYVSVGWLTPCAASPPSICPQVALAAPGIVNAASFALGSSGGRTSTGPSRSAKAAAIASVCRLAQIAEQLMQPRPPLMATLSTIMSMWSSQRSTTSSPMRIFENPGPWTCTPGLPRYCSTVLALPKIMLRLQEARIDAPTSVAPG